MTKLLFAIAFAVSLIPTAPSTATAPKAELKDPRSENLQNFFKKYKCPETNYDLIKDYLYAADKYDIDYRILPSISIIESQCGRHQRLNNWWGWNSAKTGFKDLPSGIDYITGQLADGKYYAGKSLTAKLSTYCPNPTYPARILNLMNQIDEATSSRKR